MSDKRFILWDNNDGHVRVDEDGDIISDGVIGRVGIDNVYLTTYGQYPESEVRRPGDLAVGERIQSVRYSLSGGSGYYDVYRVA